MQASSELPFLIYSKTKMFFSLELYGMFLPKKKHLCGHLQTKFQGFSIMIFVDHPPSYVAAKLIADSWQHACSCASCDPSWCYGWVFAPRHVLRPNHPTHKESSLTKQDLNFGITSKHRIAVSSNVHALGVWLAVLGQLADVIKAVMVLQRKRVSGHRKPTLKQTANPHLPLTPKIKTMQSTTKSKNIQQLLRKLIGSSLKGLS